MVKTMDAKARSQGVRLRYVWRVDGTRDQKQGASEREVGY